MHYMFLNLMKFVTEFTAIQQIRFNSNDDKMKFGTNSFCKVGVEEVILSLEFFPITFLEH